MLSRCVARDRAGFAVPSLSPYRRLIMVALLARRLAGSLSCSIAVVAGRGTMLVWCCGNVGTRNEKRRSCTAWRACTHEPTARSLMRSPDIIYTCAVRPPEGHEESFPAWNAHEPGKPATNGLTRKGSSSRRRRRHTSAQHETSSTRRPLAPTGRLGPLPHPSSSQQPSTSAGSTTTCQSLATSTTRVWESSRLGKPSRITSPAT